MKYLGVAKPTHVAGKDPLSIISKHLGKTPKVTANNPMAKIKTQRYL
jgi:hypothetical protein